VAVPLVAIAAGLLIARPFGEEDARSDGPPPTRLEAKAQRIEARLEERPDNARLLRAATHAWLDAAHDRISSSRLKGAPIPFPALAHDYRAALKFWHAFLDQTGGEASADVAEAIANAYMNLTEIGSRDPAQIEADIAGAVRASQIAGRHIHDVHTLSPVAIIAYYNGEFDRGERTAGTTLATAERQVRPAVRQQFVEYRESAEVFRRLLRQAKQELRETGRPRLAEPLKVYRSTAELNQDDPTE